MEITKSNIIGSYARYTGRSGSYHHAQVVDINEKNNVTLMFTPDGKKPVKFTRELHEIIMYIPNREFNIGDTVYYYSQKFRKYNPAVVEDIDADPANGTIIRLCAVEYGKTVRFETGLSSINKAVIYNPKTGKFQTVKIP